MTPIYLKLHDVRAGKDWYLVWSRILSCPVSYGMTLEELLRRHPLTVCEQDWLKSGTTSLPSVGLATVLASNRAGRNGTTLTVEQIVEGFCEGRLRGDEMLEGT